MNEKVTSWFSFTGTEPEHREIKLGKEGMRELKTGDQGGRRGEREIRKMAF